MYNIFLHKVLLLPQLAIDDNCDIIFGMGLHLILVSFALKSYGSTSCVESFDLAVVLNFFGKGSILNDNFLD